MGQSSFVGDASTKVSLFKGLGHGTLPNEEGPTHAGVTGRDAVFAGPALNGPLGMPTSYHRLANTGFHVVQVTAECMQYMQYREVDGTGSGSHAAACCLKFSMQGPTGFPWAETASEMAPYINQTGASGFFGQMSATIMQEGRQCIQYCGEALRAFCS